MVTPAEIVWPDEADSAAAICGARVELVPGTIADCGRWIGARAAQEPAIARYVSNQDRGEEAQARQG